LTTPSSRGFVIFDNNHLAVILWNLLFNKYLGAVMSDGFSGDTERIVKIKKSDPIKIKRFFQAKRFTHFLLVSYLFSACAAQSPALY
jgi:hypothetical protein